jgi:hypothetical protein
MKTIMEAILQDLPTNITCLRATNAAEGSLPDRYLHIPPDQPGSWTFLLTGRLQDNGVYSLRRCTVDSEEYEYFDFNQEEELDRFYNRLQEEYHWRVLSRTEAKNEQAPGRMQRLW